MKFTCMMVFCVFRCALAAEAGSAYDIKFEKNKEIELALSAAPEHLRVQAGVFVLQGSRFVRARETKNGFTCIVEREGNIQAPVCYDVEGSETTMLAYFRKAELILSGKSEEETEKVMEQEYRSGKLLAPRRPGIAYMLSTEFKMHDPKTGETKTVFPPHLMFYAPYMKNSDIGASPEHQGSQTAPWILNEGKPHAYIIVVPSGG